MAEQLVERLCHHYKCIISSPSKISILLGKTEESNSSEDAILEKSFNSMPSISRTSDLNWHLLNANTFSSSSSTSDSTPKNHLASK